VGERRCLLTTWAVGKQWDDRKPLDLPKPGMAAPAIWHAGLGTPKPDWAGKSRPGRFLPNHLRPLMPVFEIVSVRAERVQGIGALDIIAEGACPPQIVGGEQKVLQSEYWIPLWNSINESRGYGWQVNPWVWRVEFRRVLP
jgi:hypothetical protein